MAPALIERLRTLIRADRKIEAIRLYRQETGAGLREAKDAVDTLERSLAPTPDMTPPAQPPASAAPAAPPALREVLAAFAEDLTARARSGAHGDIYRRESETQQILQALASPLKGRVAVLGPPRCGKTAVIQRVAAAIASGACPPELAGKEVWSFTPGSLPGLSPQGAWRGVLDLVFGLWSADQNAVLYIDEITRSARLPGSGSDEESGIDVAMAIAASLKRLPGLCLVEAEETAWRRFCDAYPDYGQLFLPVRVEPFDSAATRDVLRRVAEDLSILHGVSVTEEALEQALDLSQRYALDHAQPGKAIDVLRDALAVFGRGGRGGEPLTADDVIRRFGEHSGLPRMLLDDSVPFDEAAVLRTFRQRVLGQDQAVEAIVQALSLLRARVHNPLRPMGVFLFLGPTGVGKTELARTLAEYLYGDRERLVRFNMADYSMPYQASELFGNPYDSDPGARRGQLSNRLAGKMFSVIVLDEFEKAFYTIYQRFLQLFDEGLLINGNDEIVNLRNAIFILTSNFGARLIEHGRIGFAVSETAEAREKRVLSETEQYFTPEFMNRMDAVCIFHPLNRAVMADIARREIGDLLRREGIVRRRMEVEIDDEVIEHVVALGYSPHYGARYLKRQIEKIITYPLAREINANQELLGGTIRLYMKRGRVTSAYLRPLSTAAPPPAEAGEPLPAPPGLDEMRSALPVLAARVEALEELHGLAEARLNKENILAEMADVGFWDDPGTARRKLDRYQQASSTIDVLGSLRGALDTLARHLGAPSPALEAAARAYKYLTAELPRVEFTTWLSGPHDALGAYVAITVRSKAAGARHWAADLARMYLGWARRRGMTPGVVGEDQSPDGRATTAVLAVSGFGVYGLLRGETGTHRLIEAVKLAGRESVQRVNAAVTVWPELGEEALPTAADLDVRVKVINRGGLLLPRLTQQVTVRQTSSDRRVTLAGSMPAEDLAAEASRLLRTQLYLLAEGAPAPDGASSPPSRGELIRSYVRNTRDKGVSDHRIGLKSARVKQVLEGDLQAFLEAAMRPRS
jgi:ATP-dependent Clp protease ATP-binding subunit ClpA/protein subunit release factor A